MRCLVLGATGYVGSRLVQPLLDAGHDVRCLVRDPHRLAAEPWAGRVEVHVGDLQRSADVRRALDGVDVVHYLAHALDENGFADRDRRSAQLVARHAAGGDVRRIVYLGGIRPVDGEPSPHLRSRAEVGDILLGSGVPTVVLQAAMITGAGSASFEIVRHLTERLPVMLVPGWGSNRMQPIAIRDVLRYLVECADLDASVHRSFDIGGPDVLTYVEMIQHYARVAGLPRRLLAQLPLPAPRLSARFIAMIAPVPRVLVESLLDSLVHEMVCADRDIAAHVPDPEDGLLGFDASVRDALEAGIVAGAGDPAFTEQRSAQCTAPPERLWSVVSSIGGSNGWYSLPLVWEIRGLADHLLGGVGGHRGRRHPRGLQVGDAIDSWVVERVDEGRTVRLRSEMVLPGDAWLELRVEPGGDGGSVLHQRVEFAPSGVTGYLYWMLARPLHGPVFGTMTARLTIAAERSMIRQIRS